MRHLRHPIRAIREPFGTAGLIIACLALVLAFGGAAVAATGGLTAKQKKEVEKIAKQLAGKRGPAGPAGVAGPAGAAGPAGTKGDAGAKGDTGLPGSPGAPGAAGKEGSPWTAGGTLPKGKTETGTWSFGFTGEEINLAPISFAIPLATSLEQPDLHFVAEAGDFAAECPGSAVDPKAAPGNICVYVDGGTPLAAESTYLTAFVRKSGAILEFKSTASPAFGGGTFAVTAP